MAQPARPSWWPSTRNGRGPWPSARHARRPAFLQRAAGPDFTMLFWNTYRLGSGTAVPDQTVIEGVLGANAADYYLLCEITSDVTLPAATIVSKQLSVPKRDKRKSAAQLGYTALDHTMAQTPLTEEAVDKYTDLFGHPIHLKGGNVFAHQSKRLLASLGNMHGVEVFAYHSNASSKSKELIPWVLQHLASNYVKFVLVGDINCEPADLNHVPATVNVAHGGATHNARHPPVTTIYDYAFHQGCTGVVVTPIALAAPAVSDHLPIRIQIWA